MLEGNDEKRRQLALLEIKRIFGKPEGEDGPNLFVEQHIAELAPSYWQELLGTDNPEPAQILNSIVLRFELHCLARSVERK